METTDSARFSFGEEGRVPQDLGHGRYLNRRGELGVDLLSQFTGTFKSNHLSLGKNKIIAGGRISSPSFSFILYTEFSEAADEHIFSIFQRRLDDLNKAFNNFGALIFGKRQFLVDKIDDLGFGQGHGQTAPSIKEK
jgi:hypothetical protein